MWVSSVSSQSSEITSCVGAARATVYSTLEQCIQYNRVVENLPLLKSHNPQADYGSISIPKQLLSIFFGHRMYHFCKTGLKDLTFLLCKIGVKMTKLQKC